MLYPLLTLCIIAQLCAVSLFTMHKSDFFHFLHKRENPSFLAFGQNARVLPAAAFRFHIYYVFANKYFRFLNVFVVFWCKCTTYIVKVLTPSFFYMQHLYMFVPVLYQFCCGTPFMVRAMRFLPVSTLSTLTRTMSPTLSSSRGCLMNLSLIWDTWTRPS